MAWCALGAKPDNLSLFPGTSLVGGENQLLQIVLWPADMNCSMTAYSPRRGKPFKLNLAEACALVENNGNQDTRKAGLCKHACSPSTCGALAGGS